MDLVESLNHVGFNGYLKQYHNTICGRHPIGVLLGVSLSSVSRGTAARSLVEAGGDVVQSVV